MSDVQQIGRAFVDGSPTSDMQRARDATVDILWKRNVRARQPFVQEAYREEELQDELRAAYVEGYDSAIILCRKQQPQSSRIARLEGAIATLARHVSFGVDPDSGFPVCPVCYGVLREAGDHAADCPLAGMAEAPD